MKTIPSLLLIGALHSVAEDTTYLNVLRQHQQDTGIVWDMPVEPIGDSKSALTIESKGALFQLWTIDQSKAKDYLLDQKFVGAYMPAADIKITTLDREAKVPTTRIDQPFTVEINLTGLLTGLDLPLSASSVLLERHLANYDIKQNPLDPSEVRSGTPFSSGYLTQNGITSLKFESSSLTTTETDTTKATGEEHFVIHSLTDDKAIQSQIASAFVQVWPVASGAIKGVAQGDVLRFQIPEIELLLNDLYPRSDTYLILYEGTQYAGVEGTLVKEFPMDRDKSESHVLRVTELDAAITEDGTYTLVLVSDTVYGREMLTDPVTFSVNRTMHVNAMQVNFTTEPNP